MNVHLIDASIRDVDAPLGWIQTPNRNIGAENSTGSYKSVPRVFMCC